VLAYSFNVNFFFIPEVCLSTLDTPCIQHKLHDLLSKDSHLRIIRLSPRVQTAYMRRETIDVEFNIEVNV
jgi:hypothetical protein